jgi:prephenate dehydrogenase
MRLAASDPDMWADILLLNREPITQALEHTRETLGALQHLLTNGDRAGLVSYLELARSFRRGIER